MYSDNHNDVDSNQSFLATPDAHIQNAIKIEVYSEELKVRDDR